MRFCLDEPCLLAGAYDCTEIESLLGTKLVEMFGGSASSLLVLGAHSEWQWCAIQTCCDCLHA